MKADVAEKAAGALKTIGGYAGRFAINTLRRALILGRYTLICWQQQRFRCAQCRVGREVLKALEQGEVNPMLAERVKDALEKAGAVRAGKEKHYQAIEAIRERIRTSRAGEAPPKAAEPPPEESDQ